MYLEFGFPEDSVIFFFIVTLISSQRSATSFFNSAIRFFLFLYRHVSKTHSYFVLNESNKGNTLFLPSMIGANGTRYVEMINIASSGVELG